NLTQVVPPEHPPMAAFDGDPHTGWAVATYNESPKVMLALRFVEPLTTEPETVLTIRLHHDSADRRATTAPFRLALPTEAYPWRTAEKGKEIPNAVLQALKLPEEKRTPAQKRAVASHFQWSSPEAQQNLKDVARLAMEAGLLEAAIPRTLVTVATDPALT